MQVELTKRIVKKIYDLNKNLNTSVSAASLEEKIDGARVQSGTFDMEDNERLFKEFVRNETGFTEEEYSNIFNPLKKVSAKEFMNDPYLKNIKIAEVKDDDLYLGMIGYGINEFVVCDEPVQDKNFFRHWQVGVFDGSAMSCVLRTKDFVWMSINPMEKATCQKAVENAKGNVLVAGGGIGYYPYLVSLKDEVSSVTVVEKDPVIAGILKENIIPQFKNEKVSVVCKDIYDFMEEDFSEKYDSVFMDTWEDNLKGYDEYIKLVKYENRYPNVRFDYWLEGSILDTITANILEYFRAKLGTEDYQALFSRVASGIWDYMEDNPEEITRPEQIDRYLTRSFAKKMTKEMKEA